MAYSPPRWMLPVVFPVVFLVGVVVVLAGFLMSSEGEPPTTGQLKVTAVTTTCDTDSVDCRTRPAAWAQVEVTLGDLVLTEVLNQDGEMWFSLDPGEYEVVVTMDDVSTEPSHVMLTPHQLVELTMNLPKRPN